MSSPPPHPWGLLGTRATARDSRQHGREECMLAEREHDVWEGAVIYGSAREGINNNN